MEGSKAVKKEKRGGRWKKMIQVNGREEGVRGVQVRREIQVTENWIKWKR